MHSDCEFLNFVLKIIFIKIQRTMLEIKLNFMNIANNKSQMHLYKFIKYYFVNLFFLLKVILLRRKKKRNKNTRPRR